jgi:hypothetical protein
MIALRQWGQKYGGEFIENPVLVDELDRLPIGPVSVISHDGRILTGKGLRFVERDDLGRREDGTMATSAPDFDRVRLDGDEGAPPHLAAVR